MGLSYDVGKLRRMGDTLTQRQKAYKRYLIADMEKLAFTSQRLARALAPVETGSLENAISAHLNRSNYSELSITLSVSSSAVRSGILNNGRRYRGGENVSRYAEILENARFNLGPGSIRKQSRNSLSQKVGWRFMDRTLEKMRKEMQEIVRNSALKAGFGRGR